MKLKKVICSFLGSCLIAGVLQAQVTIIKAGHLFDAATGKMLSQQLIAVRDGKIQQIGADIPYSPTDSIIDLSDAWVLPGLMDCHVHLTVAFPYRKVAIEHMYMTESTALRALRGAHNAQVLLMNGFTTIKEIGNDANYASADVIRAIKKGWIQGPTIIYAGKIISPYGGQTAASPEHEHVWDMEYLDANGADEIRKAVRKNIYYGANVIKVVTDSYAYHYSLEEMTAAVTEARQAGLKVTAHVMGGEAARNVINSGAAAIEHGVDLDDELLQLMKTKGTFLVGTDLAVSNNLAYSADSATARNYYRIDIDRLKRAYRIGTKMAFGSDIIIDIPGKNRAQTILEILQSWKDAGIPNAYVLQCMTRYAAELLGVEKERGLIAPALAADIIAVKTDPLKDINAIKAVSFVMKDGKIIRKD
ncbi:amidohydrolase family protein [Chitinophaga nivalis]|uniref:Amidohydrolase family protein n=1 Tax=Chitinophaga nivalis TaxID=2991709 RepID=A0ABT3IMN9_9BACT|nr:amidohydrolase family protein [Chitinophaga nivalis]MCW3465070.1 amidohydrolase family protein [Chitinophaga nivalis]MCW3485238.1 amidohydrolase family protein [Chitinophaga nivalis]